MKILITSIVVLSMAAFPATKALPERKLTVREIIWRDIEPLPESVFRVDKAVALYRSTRGRYEAVERLRSPGCPAAVIFALHMRESTWNFSRHLHEGSPLTGRTRDVPKGRIPGKNPPYTWEVSSEDALYVLKSYQDPLKWKDVDSMIDWVERYNGIGYRTKGVPSPYLVAGSSLQKPGKYVSDGKFSRVAFDKQLGCLTVMKEIARKGLWIPPSYSP